jgi:signal peptidase II
MSNLMAYVKQKRSLSLVTLLLGLTIIFADQYSKMHAALTYLTYEDVENPRLYKGSRELVFNYVWPQTSPDYGIKLQMNYVRNFGSAFGMWRNFSTEVREGILIGLTSFFVLTLAWIALRYRQPLVRLGVALLISGAIGNLIDRTARGFVIDWIDVRVLAKSKEVMIPPFNIADISIVIGLLLFILAVVKPRSQ